MKLIEIVKGMVIHCRTQEQAWELSMHSDLPQYFVDRLWDEYKSETCYYREEHSWSYCDKNYFVKNGYKVIEFEDLIIDESKPTITTKPVLDSYIVCELMSGETLAFDGMCNAAEVNGRMGDHIVFRYNNGEKFLNLAAVPMSNIKYIKYIHSQKVINNVMNESENEEE